MQAVWNVIANGAVSSVGLCLPGTGYLVNDILTVVGGTGTAATIKVAAISSGAITAAVLYAAGSYSATPNSPVTVTGGHGTGAQFYLYTTASWPDIILFQSSPGTDYTTFPSPQNSVPVQYHITAGQAIIEILNYAISCGVNLQIGQIDPLLYVPFYPARAMRCADCLKLALRSLPNVATEIDYTTTPPTFNVRQQSNWTGVTLPYKGSSAAGGVVQEHLTSTVKPRPDLVPSRVGIYVKTTGASGSQPVITVAEDIYPVSAPAGLRSFDTSLDMSGPKYQLVTGQITTYAAASANTAITGESGALNWWKLKIPAFSRSAEFSAGPALVNTAVNDGSLNCITVLDEAGNPVNLSAYTAILEHEGTIHPWMNVASIKAIVTAWFSYTHQTNINTAATPVMVTDKKPNAHAHTVRVHLCNAPLGNTPYNLSNLLSAGEYYPTGLAQAIYTSLQTLQYQFTHTILEQPFYTVIKPGKHCLNLSGGATAWATMNAMIQEVTLELLNSSTGLTSAKTTVKCGPVAHLEPGQLVQLTNLFNNRDFSKINPNERQSGLPAGGLTAAMPSETAKENSLPKTPPKPSNSSTPPTPSRVATPPASPPTPATIKYFSSNLKTPAPPRCRPAMCRLNIAAPDPRAPPPWPPPPISANMPAIWTPPPMWNGSAPPPEPTRPAFGRRSAAVAAPSGYDPLSPTGQRVDGRQLDGRFSGGRRPGHHRAGRPLRRAGRRGQAI
jgi:hypothetical protein